MSRIPSPARAALAAALILAAPAAARAQAAAPSPSLADYLAEAERARPLLEARRAELRAAGERVEQAGAFMDPMVEYEIESDTRDETREHTVRVSQAIPFWGKRGLRAEAAERETDAAREMLEAERLAARAEVKRAFAEYYFVARSERIARDSLRLLSYWESIARARYEVSSATHHDVLRAQVEMARLETELRILEDARAPASAALAASLGRDPAALLPPPETLPPLRYEADPEALLAALREANPELRALGAGVAREDAALRLADREYFPDFTLGLGWKHETPGMPEGREMDRAMGMLAFNAPLWRGRLDAAAAEAEARRVAARGMLRDRRNALVAELRDAIQRLQAADRRRALLEGGLLPKTEELVAASFAAYQNGESNFLEVLDAERTLLRLRRALERARADALASAADIERMTARPLPLRETAPAAPIAEESAR